MNKATFQANNVKDSTAGAMKSAFNAWPTKRTAYFEDRGTCYWATKESSSYDPIFHLCGAAIKGGKQGKLKVYTNYDTSASETAKGAGLLHSFEFEKKDKAGSGTWTSVKKCKIVMSKDLKALYKVPESLGGIISNIQAESASAKDKSGHYLSCGTKTVHRLYMATAYTILRHLHGPTRDGVVALIVGQDGRILSWGRKNPDVPCWHGETSAIMRLGGEIPKGSAVYSTLKPCNMCSGLIHDASGGDAKVFWGQDDPAKAAAGTILEQQKTGVLLDGNKANSAAPIFRLPKGSPGRSPMASELGAGQGGRGSAINYIVTRPALDIIKSTEAMLIQKYNKYQTVTDDGLGKDAKYPLFNENAAFVVRYLVGFLDSLNIKFASLGS